MTECIFCKIVAGEIPKYTIYEDQDVLAFLDIHPINDGHTLVIPKQHVHFVHHLNDDLFHHVMDVTKKVMLALEKALEPARVGVIVEGFDIDHAHVKVTSLFDMKDIQTVQVEEISEEYFTQVQQKIQAVL